MTIIKVESTTLDFSDREYYALFPGQMVEAGSHLSGAKSLYGRPFRSRDRTGFHPGLLSAQLCVFKSRLEFRIFFRFSFRSTVPKIVGHSYSNEVFIVSC